MPNKMVSFRIRRNAKTKQFWFAVLAGNNRTLCSSEQYKRIGGVHNALKSLILGLQLEDARVYGLTSIRDFVTITHDGPFLDDVIKDACR